MKAHSQQQFQKFMQQLLDTNRTLSFYTDFEKCYKNVERLGVKLHTLNYLVGKENMDEAIADIWEENPETFSVLPILIAVREAKKEKVLETPKKAAPLSSWCSSLEKVRDFFRETGLGEVLADKKITNLVDYVLGVEVGLDTNARKNRSGIIMENRVAEIFDSHGIQYRREVYSSEFPAVSRALGSDKKRFDFVVPGTDILYLAEVNFYSEKGGSKLNEVARAYIELSSKINDCPGFEFVWKTDGVGWNRASNKLEEAFYSIPKIYNLTTLSEFINQVLRR